jgi:hypothetical protein
MSKPSVSPTPNTGDRPLSNPPVEILAPSFRIPVGVVAIALALTIPSVWVGIPVLLFGIFLGIQAATLRIHFTETAFELHRGQTLVRCFPYDQWYRWRIFWRPIPILLYFKELRSIHFLPILFNPAQLQTALEQHIPSQSDPSQSDLT